MMFRTLLATTVLAGAAAALWRWADSWFTAEEFRAAWALEATDI